MSNFESAMVIVSIIMGFGVIALIKGAASAVRAGTSTTPGLLHTLWVAIVLVQLVGLWSARWAVEPREDWPFAVLFSFLLLPIVFYAQSVLLFPPQGRETKLSEYFLENRRPFFSLAVLSYLLAWFGPQMFYGGVATTGDRGLALGIYVAVSVFLALSSNERLHVVWALVILVRTTLTYGGLSVG